MLMPFSWRTCVLSAAVLSVVAACHHTPATDPTPTCYCQQSGAQVRSITDVAATVGFDQSYHHYVLFSTRPGRSVEVGFLCDTLPEGLVELGKRVVVSGTYYAKPGTAKDDTLQYYLKYSRLVAQ